MMDGSTLLLPPNASRDRFIALSRRRLLAILHRHRGFLLLVILPTFLSAIYFFAWAADQYQSEAKFVIYSSRGSDSGLGGLGQMLGLDQAGGSTSSETYSVIAYMESPDAVAALDKSINLTAIFRAPQADFISRLHYARPSAEQLQKYYNHKVTLTYAQETTITTLDVHAFTAADAYTIATSLLALGERQVNAYNDRITADTIKVANDEVTLGQARIEQAESAITAFRQQHGDLDPELSGTADMSLIATLHGQLVQAYAQKAQMRGLSSSSPQMQALRNRISALQQQIAGQIDTLTGISGGLAPVLAQYQNLVLQLQFAQQSYTAAQTAMEAANEDALKQKLFLIRVVEPNFPQLSLFPHRFMIVGTVFCTLLIAYGILWLLIAGVREHAI